MRIRSRNRLEDWKMEELRRIAFLKAVYRRLLLLSCPSAEEQYSICVPTVAFDAHHLENLDERRLLPAIHIMQGASGVIDEGPTPDFGDLGDIVELYPILLRCTVKGPTQSEDPQLIEGKSFQAIRLRHGVESVLIGRGGNNVLGVPGVLDTKLTEFSLPHVQENWGSPWLVIEFNYYIRHTYRKGEPV